MSSRRGGFIGHDGLNTPDRPTGVVGTKGNTQASVAFEAPSDEGASSITGFVATISDGSSNTGTSSPIVVTGLSNDTAVTAQVRAINSNGTSPPSKASASFTPDSAGQDSYESAGSYTWTCPTGITKVSVVAVGAGAGAGSAFVGGGGGALAYVNNISVTAGQGYTVTVGAAGSSGGNSSFESTVVAQGGQTTTGGAVTTGTGGAGGNSSGGGGGGAGGYSGAGGASQSDGSGGGGGGGANPNYANNAGGGGGVGLLGEGDSGAGRSGNNQERGGGGSGGQGGDNSGSGGKFGGGGGAIFGGAIGGVRVIYPGNTRQFPSTNTEDA